MVWTGNSIGQIHVPWNVFLVLFLIFIPHVVNIPAVKNRRYKKMVDGYKSAMSTVRVSCRSTELKQCFRGFGSYGPLWFVAKKILDSVCWFSHRRRTGGQHSCISYLLTRAKDDSPNIHRTQAPENTPGSHEMGPSAAAARCLLPAHTIRTQAGGVGSAKRVFVPGYVDIRTLARFLYSAPNLQVSSSYV